MSCQPLITGTMLSLDPHSFSSCSQLYHMNVKQWRKELDDMQKFGIQWLGCWSGLEYCISQKAVIPGGDLLAFLLKEAEQRGMSLSLSAGFCPNFWENWDLAKAVNFTSNRIMEIQKKYGNSPAFSSWYLDYEIYLRWGKEAELILQLYQQITQKCHDTNGLPVIVSPFFQPDTSGRCGVFQYGAPEEYYPFWKELLSYSKIDILALQDNGGQHLGCFGDNERLPFISEIIRACKDSLVHYWGNVETGELPVESVNAFAEIYGKGADVNALKIRPYWCAVPQQKLEKKLVLAAKDAEKIMTWGYMEFFRPSNGIESLINYNNYLSYLDRIKSNAQ